MNEIYGSTHAQRKFRFDANKEYARDASVAIKPKKNFAPKKR
jgi:hypothetical protein